MANGGATVAVPVAEEAENGERRSVLVTGGAGFIGTHTVLQLLKKGYDVSVVDNFHNSVPGALERVRHLAGLALSARLEFIPGVLKSKEDLEKVFAAKRYEAVVHFAGLKAGAESVAHPEMYYENNLGGTMNLYAVTKKYGCKKGLHTCNDAMDLADGHIAALEKLFATPDIGNSYQEVPRRPGDSEEVYASTEKARKELDWRAQYGIEEMCRGQWNWAKKNPYGYCGNVEKKD